MCLSHPTWVRGLKPNSRKYLRRHYASHPTWVRGLKQTQSSNYKASDMVASYVGAWIETHTYQS